MSDQRSNIPNDELVASETEAFDPNGPCMACGIPNARLWQTPDGPARLCPPCATLNGIGCP
ncbi:MAG: hypothetical protein NT081_03550 [Actinobacteria bacterium]|nr:hypothetical protein [Actinomycetota bacterium]